MLHNIKTPLLGGKKMALYTLYFSISNGVLVFEVLVFEVLIFEILVFEVLVFEVLGLRSLFSRS